MTEPELTEAEARAKAAELSERARACLRDGRRGAAVELQINAMGWDMVAVQFALDEIRAILRDVRPDLAARAKAAIQAAGHAGADTAALADATASYELAIDPRGLDEDQPFRGGGVRPGE